MHHEMRQGIIVLGLYPCLTSGKDNEKTNTFQIFPDFFIKNFTLGPDPSSKFLKDTLSRGLAPGVSLRLANGTKNEQQPHPS